MTPEPIAQEVISFLADYIDSVVVLEALLLLHGTPGKEWKASAIARELRIDQGWPQTQLQGLCNRGILTCGSGPDPTYTYTAPSADMAATIDKLAAAYADRRVTIIALIFSKPIDTLKTFGDAFRIRKDTP